MPSQENGTRPARGLPYSINAYGEADCAAGAFKIRFANFGSQTAVFQVRSANTATGPWTYTVQPQAEIVDSWNFVSEGAVAYDLSVYGPNGFFRAYKGQSCNKTSTNLQSVIAYDLARGGITLQSQNLGLESTELLVKNLYDNEIVTRAVKRGEVFDQFWSLEQLSGWYSLVISVESDPAFLQQFAGHLETGQPSRTDPQIDTVMAALHRRSSVAHSSRSSE
jgi:phospholipase C